MPAPYCVWFQTQDKLEHLKNLLDKRIHIFYIRRNLLFGVPKQFDLLCNHPKAPFQEHPLDRHEHIVYNQYMYRRFLLYVTLFNKLFFLNLRLRFIYIFMVSVEGLEPPVSWFVAIRFYPLNYTPKKIGQVMGIEPTTHGATNHCLTIWRHLPNYL